MDLQIASASVDITPRQPAPLFGYRGRPPVFDGVRDPLELNGLLLRQGDEVLLLAAADLLYVTGELETMATEMLARRLPTCRIGVLLGASHTHFAPAVDPSKGRLGRARPEYVELVRSGLGQLIEKLTSGVLRAATLHYGEGQAEHAVNRRRRGWDVGRGGIRRTMASLPNPKGFKDETVRLVSARDGAGDPVGAIWNYACHPTGFFGRNTVSSEFPGKVREAIRKRTGFPDLPVVFYQGFAGNIRPPAYDRRLRPVTVVRRFLNGQVFGFFSPEEYQAWTGSLAARVLEVWDRARPVEARLAHAAVSVPLQEVLSLSGRGEEIRLYQVSLAPDLHLVGFSAEVMSEYLTHVRSRFAGSRVVPVSCVGQTFGYLPTGRMLDEGGYEAGGFLPLFDLDGKFSRNCERRMLAALTDLPGSG